MRSLSLLLAIAFSTMACRPPECVDDGQCSGGQACIEEVCVDVECLDSSTCALEQYCDIPTHTCVNGCEKDEDCLAGSTCEEGTCEEYGCRQTDLDCEIGEVCDDGECEQADGPHCQPCDDPYFGSGCGSSATCYAFDEWGVENYCVVTCSPNGEECPRGYECLPDADGNYGCTAWCPSIEALD